MAEKYACNPPRPQQTFAKLFQKRVTPREETYLTHRLNTWFPLCHLLFASKHSMLQLRQVSQVQVSHSCEIPRTLLGSQEVAQALCKGWQDTAEGAGLLHSGLVPSGIVGTTCQSRPKD